jgi:hypothetical protein
VHYWRVLAAAACLIGLSGCNRVISADPWFTAADAQEAPKFREGLWVSLSEEDCRVDVTRPAERWPDCAQASFVRGDEWLAMAWDDPDADAPRRRTFVGWQASPMLVANGNPLIGQIEMEGNEPTATSDVGVGEAESEAAMGSRTHFFFYAAIHPTHFDEQGKVVAFETWSVECGPRREPADDESVVDSSYVTDRPFPGLTVDEDNCTAESVEALRRAATLSKPLDTHGTARWLRDGWR